MVRAMVKRIASLSLFLSAFERPSIRCFVISGIRREKVSVSLSISTVFMDSFSTVADLLCRFREKGLDVGFKNYGDFFQAVIGLSLIDYVVNPDFADRRIKYSSKGIEGKTIERHF